MDTKVKIWLNCFFVSLPIIFFCQPKVDTLEQWVKKFSSIHKIQVSENGEWILARKIYHKNSDTTYLYHTSEPRKIFDTIIKKNFLQQFVGENKLFLVGQTSAQLMNLKNNSEIHFKNVKTAGRLTLLKLFFILDHNNDLNVYNENGQLVKKNSDVQSFLTNNKDVLILVKKNSNETVFLNMTDNHLLYKTTQPIQTNEIARDGKYLLISEKSISNNKIKPIIINMGGEKIVFPDLLAEYVIFTPNISNNGFIVAYVTKEIIEPNPLVDIWYGNDKNLRSKLKGNSLYQFWSWYPSQKIQKISEDNFRYFTPLNNDNLFLSFPTQEKNNYVLPSFTPDISIYNKIQNKHHLIAEDVSSGVISRSSKYILTFNALKQYWKLFITADMSEVVLEKQGLKNPIFSSDEREIFFESDNDLWIFDTSTRKLRSSSLATGKKVTFQNINIIPINEVFGPPFFVRNLKKEECLILNIFDNDKDNQSIQSYSKSKLKVLIPFTTKRIKYFVMLNDKKIFTIEESFKDYPVIYHYNSTKSAKTQISKGFDGNLSSLKQDILHFKNSKGSLLKGVLYYPVNFNTSKKYPIIVNVYEKQGSQASTYLQPQISGEGFDIRLFIENGYFVFLPDTVTDERGPGVSALDCVNSSLDEVLKNTNIDSSKIGLMGHSFGGYETNFIATHSKRFAAFISGAGISNIVAQYFRYYKILQIPEYARLENAQLNFKVPYTLDKDLYEVNNPINFIKNINSPILLWSGLNDENIVPSETMALYMGLLREKKPVIALFYPNQTHSLTIASPSALDLNKRTLDWWNYFLKDFKGVPWINKQMKMEAN